MCAVAAHESLPDAALLQDYRDAGAYTDCFSVDVPQPVSQAQFIHAFYTTWLFRLERWLLALAGYRSSDADAHGLALGNRNRFAAWTVEARSANQLLLAAGRTRSWLMTAPAPGGRGTRLLFGSAVMPQHANAARPGGGFDVVLRFHTLYSRLLLGAAHARLLRAARH